MKDVTETCQKQERGQTKGPWVKPQLKGKTMVAMDNTALRALLFSLIGGFLLFAGVFVDAMGSSINNDGRDGILPFSPLVLVGRVMLAIGAVMLVGAMYLIYRTCQNKKKQAPYERASALADRSIELQNTHNASRPLPERPPSRQAYALSPIQTTYTSSTGNLANGREGEENPYCEVEGVSSPAAAAFIHYSATLGARNLGYSRTLGSARRGNGRGNPRILRAGFTPLHPVDEAASVHSSTEQLSRYSTLPTSQVLDTPEYNWRSHLTREQMMRNSTSTPVFKDDPPPYESFRPPPYRP